METHPYARRHVRFGWWSLLLFASLGLALELLHGFKAGFYLDVQNETRRLMWTLAHAHGVLIGLVHVAFAVTIQLRPQATTRRPLASACLIFASILLPGGFFLGGLVIHQGDPGIGVFLTPAGGLSLLAAVVITAQSLMRSRR